MKASDRGFDSFSDEEIAVGICELELKFASTKTLNFEVAVIEWILTRATTNSPCKYRVEDSVSIKQLRS